MRVKHLTPKEVLVLHARTVDAVLGEHGVRDVSALVSVCERPKSIFFGKAVYRTLYEKAGAYLEAFVTLKPFVFGNTATALVVVARFLHRNGVAFTATNGETLRFIDVKEKKMPRDEAVRWLKEHSRKVSLRA